MSGIPGPSRRGIPRASNLPQPQAGGAYQCGGGGGGGGRIPTAEGRIQPVGGGIPRSAMRGRSGLPVPPSFANQSRLPQGQPSAVPSRTGGIPRSSLRPPSATTCAPAPPAQARAGFPSTLPQARPGIPATSGQTRAGYPSTLPQARARIPTPQPRGGFPSPLPQARAGVPPRSIGIPASTSRTGPGPETGAISKTRLPGRGLQPPSFQPLATSSSTRLRSVTRQVTALPSREKAPPSLGPAPRMSQSRRNQGAEKKKDASCECAEEKERAEWDAAKAKTSEFAKELDQEMLQMAAQKPKTRLVGTRSRRSMVEPPTIMTDDGPVPAKAQIITTKSVRKHPGQPDIIAKDITTIEASCCGPAEQTEVVMSRMAPFQPHAPSVKEEAVIVQSKVTIGAGIKQTVKTVTYEGDPEMIRKAPVLPSVQEVARMVREETKIVEETMALHMPEVKRISPTTSPLRQKVAPFVVDKDAVSQLETHALCSTCFASPSPPEELRPEMIAVMMNSEERGLAMGEEPETIYNYLFANNADVAEEQKVQVTSVASYPFTDVVVPADLPDMSKEVQHTEGVQNVTIHAVASLTGNPEDTTYCAIVGDQPLEPKNTAKLGNKTKRKRVTPLAKERPPWGSIEDDKVEEVVDLVGAALATSRVVQAEADEEIDPFVEGIEYILQMEAPTHFTQVQLRGTQKPDWFPGYMMSLPGEESLVVMKQNPEEVLTAAWRATQPDIFNDDSLFMI